MSRERSVVGRVSPARGRGAHPRSLQLAQDLADAGVVLEAGNHWDAVIAALEFTAEPDPYALVVDHATRFSVPLHGGHLEAS